MEMEKTIAINFTAKEIEILQICIFDEQFNLDQEIARAYTASLSTRLVQTKKEHRKDMDALYDKLYAAKKNLCNNNYPA